jgi:hypothetical protein
MSLWLGLSERVVIEALPESLMGKPSGVNEVPGRSRFSPQPIAKTRKKAAGDSGPKFREETPKKGSSTATPIAVLHCNN